MFLLQNIFLKITHPRIRRQKNHIEKKIKLFYFKFNHHSAEVRDPRESCYPGACCPQIADHVGHGHCSGTDAEHGHCSGTDPRWAEVRHLRESCYLGASCPQIADRAGHGHCSGDPGSGPRPRWAESCCAAGSRVDPYLIEHCSASVAARVH